MYYPEALSRGAYGLMDDSSQTKLRVAARLDALPEIVAGVEAFGEERELAMKDVFEITLAVEELFANTVNYSQPPATSVELGLQADVDGVQVEYRDDAPGSFDPTLQPEPDTTLPIEQRPVGGLGIHVIRKTMKEFRYAREGGWNVVRFVRVVG